jgi:flagellar protein FlaJ
MTSLKSLLKLKSRDASRGNEQNRKRSSNGKLSFNKDLLKGDLFCHLTYMSAIATSKLPRNLLFEYASSLPYSSSRYLRKVHFLAKKLNYDYSEACRMVGETVKEPEPKAILLRMAGALASGESEADFLAREAFAIGETYGNEYDRAIESLKKWTDAYVALILSASLVVVISVVSMLIFPMKPTYIVTLTFVMLMATALGAWIMFRAAPKEVKTHSLFQTSPAQRLSKNLFKFMVVPMAIVLILLMMILKPNLGWAMVVMSILVLPTGFIMIWDDRKIDKVDADIASFLRSLGGVTKAIGTTITEALGRLDFRSLASLRKPVISLNNSLILGVKPELCWQKFVGDTGSEHINRSVQIFWDGIAVGGDPEKVGNQSSMFAMKVALLRAKRKLISTNFSFTCVVIHATIAMLLVGIYQVLVNFSTLLENIGGDASENMAALQNLPAFGFFASGAGQLQLLNTMVTAMLIMLTIVNAAAIKIVEGGHNLKFLFYFGIFLFISGISLLIVPGLLQGIFSVVQMSG